MTTRELVKRFESRRAPSAVRTTSYLEETSNENGEVLSERMVSIAAPYAWRFDVGGSTFWSGHESDAKLMAALAAPDEEDPGPVVGTMAKVRLDGSLAYGPVELHANPWRRLQALEGVVVGQEMP